MINHERTKAPEGSVSVPDFADFTIEMWRGLETDSNANPLEDGEELDGLSGIQKNALLAALFISKHGSWDIAGLSAGKFIELCKPPNSPPMNLSFWLANIYNDYIKTVTDLNG